MNSSNCFQKIEIYIVDWIIILIILCHIYTIGLIFPDQTFQIKVLKSNGTSLHKIVLYQTKIQRCVCMRIKILDYNNARRQLSCALHLRVFSFWSFPLKQLNLIPMIRKLSYQYVRGLSSTYIMCSGVYTRNITITLESHFSKYLMINISGLLKYIN